MILQTENVSSQGHSSVQSQLVSNPKEKKFEVLVISDAGDQKSGKRINLPIEKDLHVAFSTIVSRVKRDERLVTRFNVQFVLLSRAAGSVSSSNLSAFDVISNKAREIAGDDIATTGNEETLLN